MVGGYAEYVAVEDDNVAHVPDGMPLAEVSIAACTMGTILNAVREVGKLQPGESVLVTGAGGGLGLHALQIANAFGAYVIAQTSSAGKAALMKTMGAHEVVVHKRGEDFSGQVRELTRGARRGRRDRQRRHPPVPADAKIARDPRPVVDDRATDR